MKTLFTTLLISLVPGIVDAQQVYTETTEYSNAKFLTSNNGSFFTDHANGSGGYFVPKDSLISAFYNMSFWIMGEDVNGQLHGAIAGPTNSDFGYGPIADNYVAATYIGSYANRFWEVYRSEIEFHIAHYQDIGYQVPDNIAFWPGNGNVQNGEAYFLAPFYDVEQDGMYEPEDGDYPLICGDRALFSVVNDDKFVHPSGTQPIGVEVHLMFYQFNDPNDEVLSKTVFLNTSVYNRGTISLYNVRQGYLADFDLGNPFDDYIGTSVDRSLAFAYNGDLNDEFYSGNEGFGEMPPAVGVVALNGNMSSHVQHPASASTATEYYNLLNGLHADGSPILDDQSNPTTFEYTGDADGWSEYLVPNASGDRRTVIGFDEITLQPEASSCFNNAIVFARSEEGALFSSADSLFAVTDHIQQFFNQLDCACANEVLGNKEFMEVSLDLFPNPANDVIQIEGIESGSFELINLDGKVLAKGVFKAGKIDLSNISNGYYILQIQSNNKVGRSTFIKN